MATCQFFGLGKVCSWSWIKLVAKICSLGDFPCIGYIGNIKVCLICALDMPKVFLKYIKSF